MSEVLKKCSQKDCSYSTTGICMEGIKPTTNCSYLDSVIKSEGNSTDENSTDENPNPNDDNKSLFHILSGEDLTNAELSEITYKYPSKLIVLVGEPECGKSTLYASLFDQFQKKELGNYYFHGSLTPIGFERRAHNARVISQNRTPKTERTKATEFSYLHLSLREKSLTDQAKHILFGDVNGEVFQRARNSDEEMTTLTIFKRASQIFFVADGEALIDNARKHAAKSNFIKLIDRALQNNMILNKHNVHLLITKWDKIYDVEENFKTFFLEPVIKKFSFFEDHVIKVASRSQNTDYPAGTGLYEFIQICLQEQVATHLNSDLDFIKNKRGFQMFKYAKDE